MATVAAVALAASTSAHARSWATPGGDAGRSGFQVGNAGSDPFEPMWSIPLPNGRRVATPLLITNRGDSGHSPRLVFGTDDGSVHLIDAYTGARVGPAGGIPLNNSRVPHVFSGLGGAAGIFDTSSPGDLGQLWVVYNDTDQADPFGGDPSTFTNDVAIAQIDAETARLVLDVPVSSSDKQIVSSAPVMTDPNANGDRTLLFTTADKYDPAKPAAAAQSRLFGVSIGQAQEASAQTAFRNPVVASDLAALNPLAPPSIINVTNVTTAKPPAATSYVAVATADAAAPVKLKQAATVTAAGPHFPKSDASASAAKPSVASPLVVPTTSSGRMAGGKDSGLIRATVAYLTLYRPDLDATTVVRFVPNVAGDRWIEAGRSVPLPGRPGAQIAAGVLADRLSDTGRVVVATSSNVYGLAGADLALAWTLGSGGFTRTAPVIAAGAVLLARDDGTPIAIDLESGRTLGPERFTPSPEQAGSTLISPGGPVVAAGVLVFATDKGVFAYRNVCGNRIRLANQIDLFGGTLAGDDVTALGGADTLIGLEGDDCFDGGDGDDLLDGGPGNDRLVGGDGDDRLLARAGDDSADGGAGEDLILGEDGDDDLRAGGDRDSVRGGDGDDLIDGGDGTDRLRGNAGDDRIVAGAGNDLVQGNLGNDTLSGGPGRDRIEGGDGNDALVGGSGQYDELIGGRGNDRIDAFDGQFDVVSCGPGIDAATVDRRDRVTRCEQVSVRRKPHKKKRKRRR